MGQIQENAALILNGGHITTFVYVDDKFGNTLVGKEECKKYVRNNIDKIPFIIHQELWEEEFEAWWRDSDEGVRRFFCEEQCISAENANELRAKFEQIIPNSVQQFYLSPIEFEQRQGDILEHLDVNHQLMLLIDNVLMDYGRSGKEVLEPISKRDFVSCAVFSGTFSMDDELKEWRDSVGKENIFTISKERINAEDDAILEGLRNVLWLKQIFKMKKHAKGVVNAAAEFMGKQIDRIDPSTFHKVVMDRSESEGCWEFEMLLRIMQAYLGLGMKEKMLKDGYSDFQSLTKNLRAIKNNATAHTSDLEIINAIEHEEVYESQDYINRTFSQICNGDIFRIGQGSGKEYILLCQPCNLEIRSNGYRSRKDFDQSYIVPIREYKEGDEGNKLVELLKRVDGEHPIVAELSHYARISLSLLDLVSFNEQGKAIIDVSQTALVHPFKHIIQNNMMIRYDLILKKILSYKTKYERIQGTEWDYEEKKQFKKVFCHPFEMGDEKITKHPLINPNNPNEIDFSITRVRRYKDPFAANLLSLFMNCMSRPGYPAGLDM